VKTLLIPLLLITLGACTSLPPAKPMTQVVATDKGMVSGTGEEVRSFKGIPYAKAPVGNLRWREPQPPDAWVGIRNGSQFGPDCIQPKEYPELRGSGMSEDCLNLNVWTPARTTNDKLPVLVWIYGGGFNYGSGSHPTYDGEALAKKGIIVVTINYRLGLLGFMAHPELSAESASRSSGNYGLMDQIAALKWVKENINAFGGDSKKVTVAGQSAGAMAINALLVSEKAKGLFHQTIMQSVGAMRPMSTLKQAEEFGLKAGSDIKQLRETSADNLIALLKQINSGSREATALRNFGVIVDGNVIQRSDREAYQTGNFQKLPMIVGFTANEGGGMARSHPVKTVPDFKKFIASNFKSHEQIANSVYPVINDDSVKKVLADLFSDTWYLYGTRELVRFNAKFQPHTYQYYFTQKRNASTTIPIHGDELQYPFNNLNALHRSRIRPSNESDAATALAMADAWTRFVKTGNPNGGQLPQWPQYDPTTDNYFEFGQQIRSGKFGPRPSLDMIHTYYGQSK
jgi:carboxylesterase type B